MIWSLVLLLLSLILFGMIKVRLYETLVKTRSGFVAFIFILTGFITMFFNPMIIYFTYGVLADEYGWSVTPSYWVFFFLLMILNGITKEPEYETKK